jgi:hypothetical protein
MAPVAPPGAPLALLLSTIIIGNATADVWPVDSEYQGGLPMCVEQFDFTTPAPTVTAVNARVTVGDYWKFSNNAGELPFTIGRELPKNCSRRADDCRRLHSDILFKFSMLS